MKVLIDGHLIAESQVSVRLDGYDYFPKSDVNMEFLIESNHRTECPWKGIANYFHIKIEGQLFENIAWIYPSCKEKAKSVENYIAFWKQAVVS